MIEKVDINLSLTTTSKENAEVIEKSLSPDNITTPPMTISSKVNNSEIEINIYNITTIETAIATINDLLDAFTLSSDIIEKL